ncbi:Putative methyltransferase CheR (fragment) [Magnetospirillum sp. LM-5]|uniref:chemotaxis protein CheB n=1 Tax=Magnetospirillum sp. LM-5 TaxID=2681466 RepID=UPI0013850D51
MAKTQNRPSGKATLPTAADGGAKPSAAPRKTSAAGRASKSTASQNTPGEGSLYFVGIGASAGGLEALRPFVAGLPVKANMTYIVAQHMSPDHRSLMVELLSRETKLKIEEATNNLAPQADTIYVVPPNSDVTVNGGKIRISKPTNTIGPKPSVDRFFISLADDQEDQVIGIILSGTGSDGARGIKAIKAAGGITIAQEPKSAKYDSMPQAAIRAGGADVVLPPHDIAAQLGAIVRRPRPPIAEETEDTPPSTIRGIIRQIATYTGMDFSNYKDATISRQILRRMAAIQIPSLDAYGEYISSHRRELSELAGNFLICVTSFFRDPDAFEAARRCLRELLKLKRPGDDIRIWVPGCATGEEVYSLAIILSEELGEECDKYRIQLFATDINAEAIATARAGIYPESALSGIDSRLITRYFSAQNGMYQIDKSLRAMTLFARQDLVQDPPFVRLDMISCRNLLIYFKTELQERVLKIFHYALCDSGALFLGKSESVGRLGELFTERDRKNKIYGRRQIATPLLGGFSRMKGVADFPERRLPAKPGRQTSPNFALGQDRLFEVYAPPSVLVGASGEIIEIYGDCGRFLTIRQGKADFNVFTLIISQFRSELRAFAHRVSRTRESAFTQPQEIPGTPAGTLYRMAVHFVGQTDEENDTLLLVCFEPQAGTAVGAKVSGPAGHEATERISALEQEIVLNRENLQTVIEELETANEELQSLNEEAQAANEELQASNEELETANEELQASNEELVTVNDELGVRSTELAETNNDLTNILNSLQMALIVVDANMFVTRYNQVALEFFDIPADKPQNLAAITTHFDEAHILGHISRVLTSGRTDELDIVRNDGRRYVMRLTPYVDTTQRDTHGVVIIITDVTDKKLAEDKLELSSKVFENASEGTIITDANNVIISVNRAFSEITGYTPDEIVGHSPNMLKSGVHSPEFYANMWRTLQERGCWEGEIQNRRKNGETYHEWLSINSLRDDKGQIAHYIAVFSDITRRKQVELTLRKANADLERYAYVASHDLQTPLRNIINYTQLLERKLRTQLDGDAREYMDFIIDGSKQMRSLITDLLEYSRVGRKAENLHPVYVGDVVSKVLQIFEPDLAKTGGVVVVGEMPSVMGENSLIASLFQNLIGNAIKYCSPNRTLKVSLSARRHSENLWRFAIADNGIGIEPQYFDKVFDMFQRLDPNSTAEGTGIGLTMCRSIVERLGGTISVESTPGEGSVFTFTLPGVPLT